MKEPFEGSYTSFGVNILQKAMDKTWESFLDMVAHT
jgi:hypothetical protein